MSKTSRVALVAVLVASALGVLTRDAHAEECTFTWGEALVCYAQHTECRAFGYPSEMCLNTLNICVQGVCMTLHPGCEEYCTSLPQLEP